MSAYKQYALVALKAIVSLGLIGYVIAQTDLSQVLTRLADIKLRWLAAVFLVMLVQILIISRRWTFVLQTIHGRFPFLPALRIMWIGAFFNQTLPSAIGGDLVRIWATYRAGVPVGIATSSIFLDRLTALAATLAFIALSLPLLFSLIDDRSTQMGIGVAVLVILLGFVVLMTLDTIPGISQRWRVTRFACALAHDARRVFLSRSVALFTVTLSVVVLALTGTTTAMLARALGMNVGLLECVVLMPLVVLMMMIPISIAGWGVRELAMVTAFGYVQLDPTDALTLSLAFGLATLAAGLPGGVLWLLKPVRVERAEPPEHEPASNR